MSYFVVFLVLFAQALVCAAIHIYNNEPFPKKVTDFLLQVCLPYVIYKSIRKEEY